MENQIRNRNEIGEEFKWRAEDIYSDLTEWESDYKQIGMFCTELKKLEQGMSESASNLLNVIEKKLEIDRLYMKLYLFSSLKHDEDSSIPEFQSKKSLIDTLASNIGAASSFVNPKIVALEDETLKKYFELEKGLHLYKIFIDEIRRKKSHLLNQSEENIMAMASEITDGPENAFGIFTAVDLKFEDVTDSNGNKLPLSNGSYGAMLESKDRVLRENAFKSMSKSYANNVNLLSSIYSSKIKGNMFNSKIRKYESSRAASMFGDNVDVSVYDNLITAVNNRLPLLHRYMDIKKKLLGFNEIHLYDVSTPVFEKSVEKIPFLEACEIIKKAMEPLGEKYVSDLDTAFRNRWVDAYENKGKRSGAYATFCYDSHPYILLNYTDTMRDMFTLAHELGHAMHSKYTAEKQPFVYAKYKIFVAEVASICNESLLINYLLETSEDKDVKLRMLNYFLEQFRTIIYRQTMFAEFEKVAHERAEAGEALTAGDYTKTYIEICKKYFGPNVVVDEEIGTEWSRIPHFYSSFYVYKYATGFSAALAISKRILDKEEGALEDYFEFLSSGCTDYPIELLKKAGVNMNTSKPIEDALDIFEKLMDEMEELQFGS